MSKVTVLGANGMLGHMVVKALKDGGHEVKGCGRDIFDVTPTTESVIGVKLYRATDEDTQYVVNCIGAIKPMFKDNALNAIYTNAVFPRQLANVCERAKRRLIHITTDCVFNGMDGFYNENAKHDADDDYGRSKSLGEPSNCLVIRTSIVGPEIGGRKRSLLEWVLSQAGKEVNGFTNHYWNGLTTLELGKSIHKIIKFDAFTNGTYHLFSEDVSKAELVRRIAAAFNIDVKVKNTDAPFYCDRRLRTVKGLQDTALPANLDTMLKELRETWGRNTTSQ